jgi:hypothetical protein
VNPSRSTLVVDGKPFTVCETCAKEKGGHIKSACTRAGAVELTSLHIRSTKSSKKSKKKTGGDGEASTGLTAGVCSEQGRRPTMEDAEVIMINLHEEVWRLLWSAIVGPVIGDVFSSPIMHRRRARSLASSTATAGAVRRTLSPRRSHRRSLRATSSRAATLRAPSPTAIATLTTNCCVCATTKTGPMAPLALSALFATTNYTHVSACCDLNCVSRARSLCRRL